MNDSYNSYGSLEDISISSNVKKGDISISDALADFGRLRISALTKAAELSPLVKEATIGPNSPVKKQVIPVVQEVSNKKPDLEDENLSEEKLRDDLRFTLLRRKYDSKLQEKTEEVFKDLIDQMLTNRAEAMQKYWNRQSEECKRKVLEGRIRKMELLKTLQENDNLSLLEKAKLDEQQSQIIKRQTMENMNRILEENKAAARISAIADSHLKICTCCNELTNLLQTEPLAKTLIDKYIVSINTVITNIKLIMDACKSGAITDKHVEQAEILYSNIENIRIKVNKDIDELKCLELSEQKEFEEAQKKKELQEKKAQELRAAEMLEAQKKAAAAEAAKSTRPLFHSSTNYNHYEELRTFLTNYESQYKDLMENPNLKKFRFDCQKAVNTPVNALSSVSGLHIRDKFDKLSKLLKGERVQVLDTYVMASQHPQGLFYCNALLAKKIVRQGDLLVSSNPEAAFPLAAVAVALWSQFPVFGKLLEANFHRQCPYIVPMFLPQKEGQTDKEFYLSRGYTYNDEGVVEKQDKFLKRMSGIFTLYCAIWTAKMPRFLNGENPHSLSNGWKWLASFINLKPEPDICATLLTDFFTICGSEFFKHYGKQFTKVIKLISTEYFAILQNIDEGGPKTRLEVFLQNVLRTGQIPPPTGLLPLNTW